MVSATGCFFLDALIAGFDGQPPSTPEELDCGNPQDHN
jgi:hypothetical protein